MPQIKRDALGLESLAIRMQEVIPVSRSKPYSFIGVNQVNIEALAGERAGQACVLGVDVGKRELACVVRWPDAAFERPWQVKNPSEIGVLIEKLKALGALCPVAVAMESSGTYGDVFRQAVGDAQMELLRVSGKMVKDQSETFDGVPSQHDGKDAAIIADLAGRGKGRSWGIGSGDPASQEMRYWVRKLDARQRIKQVWAGRIEAMLARHWPEVQRLLDGCCPTLARALMHWGDPRVLAADASAAEVLAEFGGHWLTEAKIAAVIDSAQQTAGVRMNGWEVREMKDLAAHLTEERRAIARCRRELRALAHHQPAIEAQAAAVGVVTACVLWTGLGDPRNYGSAAAYRKAMGLNLVEHSSGQYKGQLRISKRGRGLVRKWLYFSALRHMQHPAVKLWVERKKARDGGKPMRAIVAVMRRLALAAWHVGVNGVAFDPRLLFGPPPPQARRKQGRRSTASGEEGVPLPPLDGLSAEAGGVKVPPHGYMGSPPSGRSTLTPPASAGSFQR